MIRRILLAGLFVMIMFVPGFADETFTAGEGELCGGIAGIQCGDGLWCDPEPGTCGQPDAAGVCIEVRPFCTREYRPVCGCNGKTYGNDCNRKASQVALDYTGECS